MDDKPLRKQLVSFLTKDQAHAGFERAIKGVSIQLANKKIPKVPYTLWQLLEHIRRTQSDILNFIINPNYKYPDWPKDYWPDKKKKATKKEWDKTINNFRKDLNALVKIVKDPKTEFYSKIPHGTGQNILREILLVIDHNSYHIGEFIELRRILGAWR